MREILNLAVSGVVMDAWESAGLLACAGLIVSAVRDRLR